MRNERRVPGCVWLVLAGVGLLIAAGSGMWVYIRSTAEVVHPVAEQVPTVMERGSASRWFQAVGDSRLIAKEAMAAKNLPGMSVAVGVGDELVWAEGFGYADLEKKTVLTPKHKLRIGSASIVVTSVAVGLLIEEGKMKLDDEIQKYVPQYPRKAWPVTVRQLMGHTAGLRRDGGDDEVLLYQKCGKALDGLVEFAGEELLFRPGTEYRYSSYGWIVLSAAVEAVTGKPLIEFVEERILKVAGMKDTGVGGEMAVSYFPRFAANTKYGYQLLPGVDLGCMAGAGAFVTTASDLVRFGLAAGNGKLLRPQTLRMFETSQKVASGAETGYGLGWDVETIPVGGKPVRVTGHDGEVLAGMVASFVRVPEAGVVVGVISNTSHADTVAVAGKIAERFVGGGK